MRTSSIVLAVAAAMLLACPVGATGPERYEDAPGDAAGGAPDIVAVTVSEPDGESTVSFAIEFAAQPPLGTDMETWTDVVFLFLSTHPQTDDRGILSGDIFITGTHGVTLESQLDTGAILVTPDEMYWYVVDLAVDGPELVFTLDRKLLGSPLDLYWQVLVGVERDEPAEDEGDAYPDEGEPPAVYHMAMSGG